MMNLANDSVLAEDSIVAYPLLCEELAWMVAMTALHASPNSIMLRERVARRTRVRPAALRRAAAHIESNAHLPVTLSEIADAAGVSARATPCVPETRSVLLHVASGRQSGETTFADPDLPLDLVTRLPVVGP